MLKKLLVTGILVSVLLAVSGCTGPNAADPSALPEEPEDEVTQAASATSTTSPTETPEPTVTATLSPTETSTPTEKPFFNADEVTGDFAGQSLAVCGEVTDYGEEPCANCRYGYFSYLIIDDSFYIISYDWTFGDDWVGSSFIVKDTVELMGSKPIFVYGGAEGWDGSECEIMPDRTMTCSAGDYFKFVRSCSY